MAMMILIINDDYDDDDDEDVNDDDGDDDDDNPSSDGRCASVILNWILCSGENRAPRIPFDSSRASHSILTLKMSQDDPSPSILLPALISSSVIHTITITITITIFCIFFPEMF